MFVEIDNKDMNIHNVEKWIRTARNDNGGLISPEFAMEILTKTNHLGHIKKVLANIKEKCDTPEKIAPYREFVLSCVDGREMSPQALGMLSELASLCGCKDEFKVANGKLKIYGEFDCDNTAIVKSIEEFDALEGENLTVYFDADKVELKGCDLSKVKALKFREGAEVSLDEAENLPKDLDVSMCSKVDLKFCDLEGLNLKFREGAEVKLLGCVNLPKDLDVSMCSKVDFIGCDLEGLNLKFREGSEVYLIGGVNLPKDLDVSMCSKVDLGYCDLEGLSLKFREGAEVCIEKCKNLPKNLDVSMCSKVELRDCDLEGLSLKFREGADVDLARAENLPKDLDVSMCSYVNLGGCDLSGVKEIKFKDIEQEQKFMEEDNNFRGKVVYAVEDKKEKEDSSLFSSISKRLGSGGMGE